MILNSRYRLSVTILAGNDILKLKINALIQKEDFLGILFD